MRKPLPIHYMDRPAGAMGHSHLYWGRVLPDGSLDPVTEISEMCEAGVKRRQSHPEATLQFRCWNGEEVTEVRAYMKKHHPTVPFTTTQLVP